MSDITLTASIRSNLLSLQNASSLLDQTSERLSTGKKVNSALDNPSSFFAARGLNNRASDLSARKDGLGQAISLLQATDKSINSLTLLVEQAKATAQSAEESSTAGISTISTAQAKFVASNGTGITSLNSEALNTTADTSFDRVTGDTITIGTSSVAAASSLASLGGAGASFSLATDTIQVTVAGSGGGGSQAVTLNASQTVQEFIDAVDGLDGLTASLNTTSGQIELVVAGGANVSFTGDSSDVLTALNITSSAGGAFTQSSAQSYDTAGDATDSAAAAFGLTAADQFTLSAVKDGVTTNTTITVGGKSVTELVAAISASSVNVTASFDAGTGKISVTGLNGTALTVSDVSTGTALADLGLVLSAGSTSITSGSAYTFDDGTAVAATDLLVNVFNGVTSGDTFQAVVDSGGAGTSLTISATTTIQDLIDNINATDTALTASFNTTTGKIDVTSLEGTVVKVQITAASLAALDFNDGTNDLVNNTNVTYGVAGTAAQVASLNTDYQSILEQIDSLINDASYKGTNLLSGANNFVVKFNADGTSALTITGLDIGVTGNTAFNFTKDANGYDFTSSGDITQALTDTTAAITELRSIAATFGANLGVIQTREDFTNELVNVLDAGAGKLVNANLEEESANLLALQTRQALGIQALSISNQSNQSILSLFR